MNIQVLKLITGEEVLGDCQDLLNKIQIKNPVGIAVIRGQQGPNIGFSPFPLHSEQKQNSVVEIDKSHVVYSYVPAEDFINNYNQIFGSGIVLPSKQLIIG